MLERIQIWNVLHDGEITAVDGEGNDTMQLVVRIPYLRRRVQPSGDSFVLSLEGVTLVDFQDFDGHHTSLREEIEKRCPKILSTDSESMPVRVWTTTGPLMLDFKHIKFSLDSGQEIDFETIDRVSLEYWTEFEERAGHQD
jgi:hypothetical protein